MPNLPIFVRSSSLLEANSRVSSLSMIAESMPTPLSSTCKVMVPRASSPAWNSVHTSMTGLPASILFCTSSRRQSSAELNWVTRFSSAWVASCSSMDNS